MLRRSFALIAALLPCFALAADGPDEPESYHVQIRYQINAFRTERIRQFREMTGYFEKVGFVRDGDDEPPADETDNAKYTRMRGVVSARGLKSLLRQRHVRSLLAYPKDAKLPEKEARVRVDIQLASGYLAEVQQDLHKQTAQALSTGAKFVEAVGYDHQGSTRLVGSVPGSTLKLLIEDPRDLKDADPTAIPFRSITGIRLSIARPDLPVPSGMPTAPGTAEPQRKIAPELRAIGAGPATRLEVILGYTPEELDRDWSRGLIGSGAIIEGRLGPLVTVLGQPKALAEKLAKLDEVAHVRLPQPARVPDQVSKELVSTTWEPLRASGVAKLHEIGRRGKGTRLALIADDFTGWEKLKGRVDRGKKLPDPILFDLTAPRSRDLLPDPFPLAGKGISPGTRCAGLLLRAAPEAELTLIRIDPAAPYMLEIAARAINGESFYPTTLEQRLRELRVDRAALDERAAKLIDERNFVFNRIVEDKNWTDQRDAYQAKQSAFDADDAAYKKRRARYFDHLKVMQGLKGIRVVANTLVWSEGYPVDGSSALSRYFDDRPFRAALWFQASGDTNGQAWTGLFRDVNQNGIMEFAAPGDRLPVGQWSPELNFLGWQLIGGETEETLPAGARVRITLQWREPHDALPLQVGEDPYREPLTQLNLVVVRQPDPQGKKRPSDDLEVIAQSGTFPTRLDQTKTAATYEHAVEMTFAQPGRYAVFVQGKLTSSTSAPGENRLPHGRKFGEIRPRLFVQTISGKGRAVITGFVSSAAALGMPADARAVITVAAADEKDRIRPSSAAGAPFGAALLNKPDLLSYDEGGGSCQAASFAAGVVGSAWPTTGTVFGVLDGLKIKKGSVLRLPAPSARSPR